jgi:hypothetical protein
MDGVLLYKLKHTCAYSENGNGTRTQYSRPPVSRVDYVALAGIPFPVPAGRRELRRSKVATRRSHQAKPC